MAAQRRHNRSRRNRGRFRALYQLLAILVVAGAIVAGCIVFFRVETITVAGNSRYTAQEVVTASGVELGDYLATLDKNRTARLIRSSLPYVETVSIRQVLPDTVLITVQESDAAAAVEAEGSWWLINSAGKLLETVAAPGSHATLTGLAPLSPAAGAMAVLPEEDANRWSYAMDFLRAMEEAGLREGLTSLDCATAGTFTAEYGGRFTLVFPSTGDFEEYLAMFTRVVEEELEESETGTFDFTHYDTTGYVYLQHYK